MPPIGGWRGGYLLKLEVRWSSGNGGQPQHWRLLQCGYHLHNSLSGSQQDGVDSEQGLQVWSCPTFYVFDVMKLKI